MTEFENKLFEHYNIDALLRENKSINEKFGIFPNADKIKEGIQKFIELLVEECDTRGLRSLMSNNLGDLFCKCLDKTGCFFNECKLSITIIYSSNTKDEGCSGIFNIDDTEYETKTNSLKRIVLKKYVPSFIFIFYCDREYLLKYGVNTFIHEMMHAYEYMNRIKNNATKQFRHKKPNDAGELSSQYLLNNNKNFILINDLFYIINKSELNAFNAELALTIMNIDYEYVSYPLLLKKIKKTDIYRRLVTSPESDLNELKTITDDKDKRDILDFANRYIDKDKDKFKSYSNMIEYFNYELEKIKNRTLSLIGKLLGRKKVSNAMR